MSESEAPSVEKRQEYFVPEQVILTGPVGDFDQLLDGDVVRLEILPEGPSGPTSFDLGSLPEILQVCPQVPDYLLKMLESNCMDAEWAMALYRIVDGTEVVDAVAKLNEESAAQRLCIGAGPNYLTGYPYTIAGSPYTIAGSPYTIAGSPYTIAGSPRGGPGVPLLPPEAFGTQWALEAISLLIADSPSPRYSGRGVRVGVFDTSPYKQEGVPPPIAWVSPAPSLTVHHPPAFDLYPIPGIRGLNAPPPVLENHGLSVASLAYVVAQESDIHLYRVLDTHCRGNLFVLSLAILEFLREFISAPPSNGGVINLSLGICLPDDRQRLGLPEEVLTLDIVLALAHCSGLVLVASAGNGSAEQRAAADPEYPASLGFVTGVAASTHDGQRACFSNSGDLAAPGGDGYPGEHPCGSPWDLPPDERLKYGLLCPILPARDFPGDVALWMGTSFSAPLVSGLAALILEKQAGALPAAVPGLIVTDPAVPPDAALGAGMINVEGSLQP